MIGSLGNIIFQVSTRSVNTFQDLSFTRSANYSEHKIIGKTGLVEFTGLNAGTCSLKMTFDVSLGVNPKKSITELERMLNEHEAALFILDGALVGTGYWVIESLSTNILTVDQFGGISRADVNISLKEYHQ